MRQRTSIYNVPGNVCATSPRAKAKEAAMSEWVIRNDPTRTSRATGRHRTKAPRALFSLS